MRPTITFDINGTPVEIAPEPWQVLRSVLHQQEHFEVKKGCDAGDCGACTVLLNGAPIHSCIYPAHRLEGVSVTTVAGLGGATGTAGAGVAAGAGARAADTAGHLHPMQENFIAAGGFQCGYCTAGLIVTASTFTEEDKADLPRLLKGNLCRCTGYRSVSDAICGVSNTETADAGGAVGRSISPPAARRIVTGTEEYTLDTPPGADNAPAAGLVTTAVLQLAVLGSPHAHARILSIDTKAAAAVEGVHAVLTHHDSPTVQFSTGRHELREDDPDDSLVLDPVLRFRGQRVAAVVADTLAIAEAALALIVVSYEELPAVFDPDEARSEGAPLLHGDKTAASRIANPARNTVAELHGENGDVDAALAASFAVVSGSWQTQRVTHTALEPHATRGWLDKEGRLVLRTSSQVPFLVRDELCHIFGLETSGVRVFTARVGGGFGGKQELLTEDIITLAVLRTGRAVQYEFTRRDEFTISPVRHPMRIGVTLGATEDGILTAMAIDELMDAGAYGNHSVGVMFHSISESISLYRCANKRVDAQSVYTNNLPSGAFRGYGLGQVIFGIESAMDELARTLDIDPFELRRRNVIVPGDPIVVTDPDEENDLLYTSYGLDQCLDLAEAALARWDGGAGSGGAGARSAGAAFGAVALPEGPTWSMGTGMATAMIASIPPRGHFAEATISLLDSGDYEVKVGTADFGSGTTTVHAQLVATALATSVSRVRILQSDTDLVGYDTGAYGSAGVLVAGKALFAAAQKLGALMVERAGGGVVVEGGVLVAGEAGSGEAGSGEAGSGETGAGGTGGAGGGGAEGGRFIAASALLEGGPLVATGAHDGTPRTVAFNVHAFRVAVNSATGEVRILQSIQAADAGIVLNPEQLRGQIEGGTAQAIGSALYEELMLDGEGRVLTDAFRNYHIPQFADVPRTEVYFADTHDQMGPLGAKSMSEAPYNPVAPALANAIRDALGQRPYELPMSRDRLWRLAQGR